MGINFIVTSILYRVHLAGRYKEMQQFHDQIIDLVNHFLSFTIIGFVNGKSYLMCNKKIKFVLFSIFIRVSWQFRAGFSVMGNNKTTGYTSR